jgi:uncharacterized protein (DUF2252 family)
MIDPLKGSRSPAEHAAAGKAARTDAPRSSHGEWASAGDRPDPIGLLEAQASSRVGQLVPLRYARMLASPFAFYRGAAAVMAADLAGTPRSGFAVQLCGDAHLSNFGAFASPDRELLFDVNDFDETLPGPWEWDILRLAASFAVAGRESAFKKSERLAIVAAMAEEYRLAMRRLADLGNLEVWYTKMDVPAIAQRWGAAAGKKEVAAFRRNLAKTQAKDRMRALSKLTHEVDGELRIVSEPPLIVPIEELFPGEEEKVEAGVREILANYRDTLSEDRRALLDSYRFVHAAMKVVGVGSVGTRAWIMLMLGRDGDDPLFLQLKEARESVLEPFLGASGFANHGERVVEGQRLTQAASDILLGWIRITDLDGLPRDFYVRQLWDAKGSAVVETMNPVAMALYAQFCGRSLAKAHARSGDAIAIGSYLGRGEAFDRALASFAEVYADQNEHDYGALRHAVAAGRVRAESGM